MAKYRLLSVEDDPKTSKGTQFGWLTGILYLAPSTEADGVHNLCYGSTKQCVKACLFKQGMASFRPSVKKARVRKTLEYLADPAAFEENLAWDIQKLIKEAKSRGLRPAVRINGTSDVPKLAMHLAARFPEVQFYDYTKLPKPWLRMRANYHITYSHSGENLAQCFEALSHGVNVAVVFHGGLPANWHGYEVVDGDVSDLRFLDAKGVIVGLSAKGTARQMETGGFIQIGKVA